MDNVLLVLLGPTGVGKTDVGVRLAQHFSTAVVSADARQVFREMRIGTAVPDAGQLAAVPHYFIGSHSIHEHYTAGRYEMEALALLERLFVRHATALLVGGSGLYIDAVCTGIDPFPTTDEALRRSLTERLQREGIDSLRFELKRLDPATYRTIDLKNPQRMMRALEVCIATGKPYSAWKTGAAKPRPFRMLKVGLRRPREELYGRINARVGQMMADGLLDEARALYPCRTLTALKTVGYTELFDYLDGLTTLDTAVERIRQHTRHYAKKQLSYWSRDPAIHWFEAGDRELLKKIVALHRKINT
ncbi:MAG: tRNA (adenosine(37)-N6)-dimethylallyltransferase MiaA [Prevotellaceae bacterium]|jgi:tRNA dimethylallyltransferase|nr:tRNA (adenosine(37)-N6)-dimethylallyltransferase MiaA [Prevotellaceae bacterium]